jgi:hypothetical protein
MQSDKAIHFAEKIKKQIPPTEKIGKPVVVTPIEEPVVVTPEPAIVIETPVEQPPSYGGGGGGGGGSIYREYDTLDRQNLADGGMGRERIEYT